MKNWVHVQPPFHLRLCRCTPCAHRLHLHLPSSGSPLMDRQAQTEVLTDVRRSSEPPTVGYPACGMHQNPQCGTPPAPCRELVREEGPTVATTAPPLSPEPGPHEPHSHKRGAKRSAAVVHVAQVLDRTDHHRHRTQRQRSAQGGGRLRTASRKTNALQVNGLRRSSPQERTRAKRLQRLHTQTTRNDARNSQHNID